MDALQIFQKLIGARIPPVVFKWPQYTKNFLTYPYHHSTTPTFENEFVDLNFDSIVFYAYEKEEIEKEYNRGRFSTLSDAARNAYERRVPKTERVTDGLVGELTLDSFIKCFFNIIINRLDEIGGFLERIKNNQYMLYSQLSEINTELSALNATTTAMLNGLRDTTEAFLEHSAVIAHNSAVSAYYSKVNAEIASSARYISMICW